MMYDRIRKPKATTLDALKAVAAAIKRHRSEVESAMRDYRDSTANLAATYSAALVEQKISEAKQSAQTQIKRADLNMSAEIKRYTSVLRDSLHEITSAPIPEDFERSMRIYKDFGLKMTKSEVEGFAGSVYENYPAVRVLAAVAAGSGFKVSMPSVAQMEKDIRSIERVAFIPRLYTPDGFVKEALTLYPDTPVFRDDGSVAYNRGKPDSITLTMFSAGERSLEKTIDVEMLSRWERVQPVVEQVNVKDYLTKEAATEAQEEVNKLTRKVHVDAMEIEVSNDEYHAIEAAQRAKSERESRDILNRYK